jgi:integrase
MSRDAIERRVALHVGRAATTCPSILAKAVTTHTLRHTCSMRLLAAGVEITVIALWLGHEQVSTTYGFYLHADMSVKERAVARVAPLGTAPGRYRAPDALMAFLEAL